jgi:hypothetical protein
MNPPATSEFGMNLFADPSRDGALALAGPFNPTMMNSPAKAGAPIVPSAS